MKIDVRALGHGIWRSFRAFWRKSVRIPIVTELNRRQIFVGYECGGFPSRFCIARQKGGLKYSPWLIAVDDQRIGLPGSEKPMD